MDRSASAGISQGEDRVVGSYDNEHQFAHAVQIYIIPSYRDIIYPRYFISSLSIFSFNIQSDTLQNVYKLSMNG